MARNKKRKVHAAGLESILEQMETNETRQSGRGGPLSLTSSSAQRAPVPSPDSIFYTEEELGNLTSNAHIIAFLRSKPLTKTNTDLLVRIVHDYEQSAPPEKLEPYPDDADVASIAPFHAVARFGLPLYAGQAGERAVKLVEDMKMRVAAVEKEVIAQRNEDPVEVTDASAIRATAAAFFYSGMVKGYSAGTRSEPGPGRLIEDATHEPAAGQPLHASIDTTDLLTLAKDLMRKPYMVEPTPNRLYRLAFLRSLALTIGVYEGGDEDQDDEDNEDGNSSKVFNPHFWEDVDVHIHKLCEQWHDPAQQPHITTLLNKLIEKDKSRHGDFSFDFSQYNREEEALDALLLGGGSGGAGSDEPEIRTGARPRRSDGGSGASVGGTDGGNSSRTGRGGARYSGGASSMGSSGSTRRGGEDVEGGQRRGSARREGVTGANNETRRSSDEELDDVFSV
ncbi:hypothetical protein OC842_006385 [Tilletia horrida]|uniref:Uncharacterized protein n=1 Tax=Tilletia horrida TaxID=155126 RepID=A0AAN6JNE8_9BASI|nr:hypothetical protein OC842_006385 [Tilletia horrida]